MLNNFYHLPSSEAQNVLFQSSGIRTSTDVLMGGYWSKKEEAGEEKGQKKRKLQGGGRRVVGRGVRLEQREGAVMVRGVSSLDGLLVLRRTR